jgi:hypothetical protein
MHTNFRGMEENNSFERTRFPVTPLPGVLQQPNSQQHGPSAPQTGWGALNNGRPSQKQESEWQQQESGWQSEDNPVQSRAPPRVEPRGPPPSPAAPNVHAPGPQYVLYLNPRCVNSGKAHQLIAGVGPALVIENTDQMKADNRPIPQFLKGTPTLLDMGRREAYTGTKCLALLPEIARRLGSGTQRATAAQLEDDSTKGQVPMSPFVTGGGGSEPAGLDGGGGDLYAPCEFQPTDANQYIRGRAKNEDNQESINRMLEERSSSIVPGTTAGGAAPSPAQQAAIMNSILESD